MPDETTPELKDKLEGVLKWVQEQKDKAKTTSNPSSPWGWVLGLLASALVFFALAFVAWEAWKKGKEIAKLKHQVDVNEEQKRQAEINAKLTSLEDNRKKLEKEADDLGTKIKDAKEDISLLESEREAAHKKIDLVTSWEDVDTLLKK
jgi:septal ring factor EnvC (AmiA/AmiB activator)